MMNTEEILEKKIKQTFQLLFKGGSMPNIEIEKKFLMQPIKVECFLKINSIEYEVLDIEQFYIERDGKIGRIKKINDKYLLTLKKGDGLVREEHESEIEQSVFKNILSKERPAGTLKKIRYRAKVDKYEYEIDEYKENLNGLVILEVEFETEEDAHDFKLNALIKPFVIKDVTGDAKFLNETIAIKSLKSMLTCEDIYNNLKNKT